MRREDETTRGRGTRIRSIHQIASENPWDKRLWPLYLAAALSGLVTGVALSLAFK